MTDHTMHPKLQTLRDKHARKGHHIRDFTDNQLVVWIPPASVGCLGMIIFWLLVIVSLGLALLFGILAFLDKSGTLVTYTVKRSGKVKKKVRRGVR